MNAQADILVGAVLTCSALICPSALRAQSMPAGAYEVITEIGMPHLQENLRYATVRETRCFSDRDLATAFPVLRHQSLDGCTLGNERRHEDMVYFMLTCERGQATTGTAHWRLGADQISGTLDVKLGGKNMTFYQRITARRLGDCWAEAK